LIIFQIKLNPPEEKKPEYNVVKANSQTASNISLIGGNTRLEGKQLSFGRVIKEKNEYVLNENDGTVSKYKNNTEGITQLKDYVLNKYGQSALNELTNWINQQQEREKQQKTQTSPRIENSQTKNLASEKRVDDLQKQGEFVNDQIEKHKDEFWKAA